MSFQYIGLSPWLTDTLDKLHFVEPTPVQLQTIPHILNGQDLLATAQTGTGKTAAFLLPLMQMIAEKEFSSGIQALILAPTRELASQIHATLLQLDPHGRVTSALIYGGVEYQPQIESLNREPNIVVATPGRLIDLQEKLELDFSQLSFFILDEVDQMLDLGFAEPIRFLASLRPECCQSLYFSATMPDSCQTLIQDLSPDVPVIDTEQDSSVLDRITQSAYFIERNMMDALLLHLFQKQQPAKAIVFTRSRKMADKVAKVLTEAQFPAEAFHSDRSQTARQHILNRFTQGETKVIVATDVMARGIHVNHVSHVYNYGLPLQAEIYVHRIGRTARAGEVGVATTMCEIEEKGMLSQVQKLMKRTIPIIDNHPYITLSLSKALLEVDKPRQAKKKKRRR